MYAVAFGNAFDGISLTGPFHTADEASAFADGAEGDWNVIHISPPPDVVTPTQSRTVEDLRDDGYAVIVWTPDEVGDAYPSRVEERLIELGWDVIEGLGGPTVEGYCEGEVPIG